MRHCRDERVERGVQPIGARGFLSELLRGARSALSQVRAAPGEPLLCLDAHLLSDIGMGVDAIRRDPPRRAWPS